MADRGDCTQIEQINNIFLFIDVKSKINKLLQTDFCVFVLIFFGFSQVCPILLAFSFWLISRAQDLKLLLFVAFAHFLINCKHSFTCLTQMTEKSIAAPLETKAFRNGHM